MPITKHVLPTDPDYLKAAFELDGLQEIVGSAHEPKVVQFFADTGHSWVTDDETAWCAAFMHSMLGRGGFVGTGSLAARSYEDWGQHVSRPQRGDVVIFKRGNSSWQGHVAFFLGVSEGRVTVLGGNQRNAVGIDDYSELSMLGYRRPSHNLMSGQLVRLVQQALVDKGYHEVGAVDGDFGSKTRGAILAFQADNNIGLTGHVTSELFTQILEAGSRVVGEARATGQPENSRIVNNSNVGMGTVGTVAVGTAVTQITPVIEQIEQGADLITRLKEATGPLLPFLGAVWPIILVGGTLALAVFFWRTKAARIEDYQSGKTAR